MDNLIRLQRDRKSVGHFFFTRGELGQLLSLYSSRVAAGEWRDYALDQLDDMVLFSIFRHTHERPLYSVAKTLPRGQRRPSYTLFNGPKRLKTTQNLRDLLLTFDKLPRLVTG
ncbi:hypothetical protein BAL199_23457 [alpha proteobacterium BAL199]|jgi:hypothetical protein|nr:hypothetical protein BAL199_23457 [alpha proteobacterium BAL199]